MAELRHQRAQPDVHDPDARSSGKTAKDGTTGWFYGYDLHLLVRVAEPGGEYAQEPNLIERFAVTPAGRDLVSASQDLIRRAQPWLGPERIVIGGYDLFAHPAGRYPGDASSRNAYASPHRPDVELDIIELALRGYAGEVVVMSDILRDALERRRERVRDAA